MISYCGILRSPMNGYEVISITSNLTAEEMAEKQEKDRTRCIEYVRELYVSGTETEQNLEIIWLILTSRGDDKLIYGPMPDFRSHR